MSKVLIVDDESDALGALAAMVGTEHEVVTAHDKQSALKLLVQGDFDVVVADWMLPDGRGTEVLQAARSQGVHGVLVTGFNAEEVKPNGQFILLFKPVQMDKLLCWVRSQAARTELTRSCAR